MSRVIKAAHVQFASLARDDSGMIPPGTLVATTGAVALEHQALAKLEEANEQAAKMLSEAEHQASCMLTQAQEQAQERLRAAELAARAQAEEMQAQAHQQGFAEGVAQGLDEGRRQAAGSIAAAAKVLLESQERAEQRLLQSEAELVELATAMARRIIGHELTTAPEAAVSMAHQVLAELKDTPHAVLRVSEEILPLYRERLEAARAGLKEMVALEIIADPLLRTGDFLIETPAGTVDGRLDAQLDVLRKALLNLSQERAGLHA